MTLIKTYNLDYKNKKKYGYRRSKEISRNNIINLLREWHL